MIVYCSEWTSEGDRSRLACYVRRRRHSVNKVSVLIIIRLQHEREDIFVKPGGTAGVFNILSQQLLWDGIFLLLYQC